MEIERQEKFGFLRLKIDLDYEEMLDVEVMENFVWIGIQLKIDDDI